MTASGKVRRAQLYIPGDDLYKIKKGAALTVDSLVLDMEDGVALAQKPAARQTIAEALRTVDFGPSGTTERCVRINPVGSGLESDDLAVTLPAHPDAVVVPKVESAEQVQWASAQIAAAEQANGWTPGVIRLLVLIETARGTINLKEIASADDRLDALVFGAYDMASSLGAVSSKDGWEVFYHRSALVTYAAAFGLQALDSVYIDLHDIEGLTELSLKAMQMGFSGKQAIHPRQVEPIQAVFTPSDKAIEYAQRLVTAFEDHQRSGRGVFAFEGKMIDMPLLREAKNVLAKAKAAGKLP